MIIIFGDDVIRRNFSSLRRRSKLTAAQKIDVELRLENGNESNYLGLGSAMDLSVYGGS